MSTKMLLPSSSHIPDRYFFHSQSNDRRISSKNRLDTTSPSRRKRYKFSSTNNQQHSNTYKFPTHANEKRSYSSDSTRYYFPFQNPQQTLTYRRAGSSFEQPSGTSISDTPYLFSTTTTTTTTKSQKYPSTTTTFLHSEGKRILNGKRFRICFDRYMDISTSTILFFIIHFKSQSSISTIHTNGYYHINKWSIINNKTITNR
jgi:hypothetical protein